MNIRHIFSCRAFANNALLCTLILWSRGSTGAATTPTVAAVPPLPRISRFENFGEKDGLPSHKVHSVLKASDGRLWLGTTNGLCVREPNGAFRRYGPEDGLSHAVVLSMAEDTESGDLWLATMQGLSRFSGGKFTTFTQTNSGLPNNVVYGVAVIDGERVCACVRERVPDRVCVCDVVSERVCEGVGDGVVTVPTCDGVRETLRDDD